ncbi:MAG: hypothetical protein AAGL68_05060 [Pseudomonadota bacterium]
MSEDRIEEAMARIELALARIDLAQSTAPTAPQQSESEEGTNSPRIMALVNAHEKLREEVADTLTELDGVIAELEE